MAIPQAVGRIAGGTIPAFRCLINSSGEVVVATGATVQVVGCSQDTTAVDGDSIPMYLPNQRLKLTAGAAIAENAKVMPAAGGKIVTYVSGNGNYPIGIALQPAGADNDVIDVDVRADLNPQVVP